MENRPVPQAHPAVRRLTSPVESQRDTVQSPATALGGWARRRLVMDTALDPQFDLLCSPQPYLNTTSIVPKYSPSPTTMDNIRQGGAFAAAAPTKGIEMLEKRGFGQRLPGFPPRGGSGYGERDVSVLVWERGPLGCKRFGPSSSLLILIRCQPSRVAGRIHPHHRARLRSGRRNLDGLTRRRGSSLPHFLEHKGSVANDSIAGAGGVAGIAQINGAGAQTMPAG